ncbi:MAG: DUF1097 domain-containing protein [Phycisphaerales bacterium]|nr:DUF1097 domain-containing protein [Phycisphaerales bacterium]
MKMTLKQFMPIPIMIAAIATVLVVAYNYIIPEIPSLAKIVGPGMPVTFQAWAMYFMAGCTILGGLKVLVGYAGGIAASIFILEVMNFSPANFKWMMALAVFVIVIPVIMAERVKLINHVPAWFVGSGMFFVLRNFPAPTGQAMDPRWAAHCDTAMLVLTACLIGQIFGIITVWCRMAYEGMLPKPAEEAVAVESGVAETPAVAPTPIAEPAAEECDCDCDCEVPAEASACSEANDGECCGDTSACETPAEDAEEKPAE